MTIDIKGIFNAITPENIKSIPLISVAMDIFINNIKENSTISESIEKIYENEFISTDSKMIQEAKLNLRKGLLDVYLVALYQVLVNAQNNEIIRAKFDQLNIKNTPFFQDVERIISDEYFISNKVFKESVGTNLSIKHAYNLTKYLQTSETDSDLKLNEIKPFHFSVGGSVLREMYENIVKPLSHPIGFTYEYIQTIEETIQDLFGVTIVYHVNDIEIRNLDGRYDVFTPKEDDSEVKADFLKRLNPLTNLLFTESDYYAQVTVFTNKVVDTFVDKIIKNRIHKSILFTDGTYLQQLTNPIDILYTNYSDFIKNNNKKIKEYGGHWSLYVDYSSDYQFNYIDKIDQIVMQIDITKIKEDNDGLESEKYYTFTSSEFAFHVGGDDYSLLPGIDESKKIYILGDQIKSEVEDKFSINITGKTSGQEPVTITITDSIGFSISKSGIEPDFYGNFNTIFNTYELNTGVYSVSVTTENLFDPKSYKFKSTGLNEFNNIFYFNAVYDNNHNIPNTIIVSGVGPIDEVFNLIISDNSNSITTQCVVNEFGNFTSTIDITTLNPGFFKINATIFETNGKPRASTFYEGYDLKTHLEDIQIKVDLFSYINGEPNLTGLLDVDTIISTENMLGNNSTTYYVNKKIGELSLTDTYSNPDVYLLNYMIANGISSMLDLPSNLIIDGALIEGNIYNKSDIDNNPLEETFINFGRIVCPIDTSDFIIMTSTDYVNDDIIVYPLSTSGYYLYSDEQTDYDYYFYTSDEFLLTTTSNTI